MVERSRRAILFLALSVPFLGGVWPWLDGRSPIAAGSLLPLLKYRLRNVFTDLNGARDLGRHYLTLCPEDAALARLSEGLLTVETLMSSKALIERIAMMRVRDFEDDNTVSVDGWILARTEARVCALLCEV